MTAAASYLGLSAAQLQTDIQNGQTLAQIAKANGKSVDGLVAAMSAQVKKTLDTAVAQGVLTQAQATQIASRLQSRMKDMANGVRPRGGFGRGGFGPGGGQGAPGGSGGGAGTGSFGSNA
jgi:ribosomal protein S20